MHKLPARLVDTNNKIMKESAFAFLPISAGSLIMLVQMGKEIPAFSHRHGHQYPYSIMGVCKNGQTLVIGKSYVRSTLWFYYHAHGLSDC